MATPLYQSDIITPSARPVLTELADNDIIIVNDTSESKISTITKVNLKEDLGINDKADKTELLALGEVTGSAYDGAKGKANAENISTNAQAILDEKTRAELVEGEHNSRLNALEGIIEVGSWKKVQEVVRQGVAENYFSIGDELVAEYNSVETVFEVLDFDHDIPVDDTFTHSMTIQSKDIMRYGSRIDAPQALYNAEVALPVGTHIFTTNGVQYQFVTTVEVPIGGVIYIATRNEYIPLTLTTYQADRLTEIESGLVCTVTTGTDDLTVVNDYIRCRYGSNRYIDSALKQWMNSSEDTFTQEFKSLYDMPSSYETKGFLKLLDPELVEVLGSVKKQVAQATYDGGGQDLFDDKIFLPSRVEMGYGTEGDTTDESVYALYDGATNEDKIKLNSTSPSYWWLRSPYVGSTGFVRIVYPSGALTTLSAYNGGGVAPACVIV